MTFHTWVKAIKADRVPRVIHMIEDKIDTVFISLEKKTFRYSFTMNFNCTNNIEECEEILIGLKVAVNHGIKKINVIFDSKLGMAQIKETYASRNKRFQ